MEEVPYGLVSSFWSRPWEGTSTGAGMEETWILLVCVNLVGAIDWGSGSAS